MLLSGRPGAESEHPPPSSPSGLSPVEAFISLWLRVMSDLQGLSARVLGAHQDSEGTTERVSSFTPALRFLPRWICCCVNEKPAVLMAPEEGGV